MDCINRSKMKLKPYQKKIIYFMSSKRNRGLLVIHPTGTGKTLSAVTYSQCFLDRNTDSKVIFIGPASLLTNFKKTLKDYGINDIKNYRLYSYQKFLNDYEKIDCTNNLLIIDEVHNLRNFTGKRQKTSLACSNKAKKILLLTATPFMNDLTDFIPLINLVHGFTIITKKSQLPNISHLKNYLRNKVDFIPKSNRTEDFPKFKEHFVTIFMPREYEKDYCKLIRGQTVNMASFSSPRAFYNAHRRAVNKIGHDKKYFSLKMNRTIRIINNYKSVIFSNWLEFGIDPITDALNDKGISNKSFSGKLSQKSKDKILEEFNENKFQVLIITGAGKEGLDLKGVRKLIIMDPVWNYSGMEQIKGRAIRYRSHSHLPSAQRFVDVYYLILATGNKDCVSGDSVVYQFIESKKKLQTYVDKALKEISI